MVEATLTHSGWAERLNHPWRIAATGLSVMRGAAPRAGNAF